MGESKGNSSRVARHGKLIPRQPIEERAKMSTYAEIQAQIAELQNKAKEARAAELAGAKAQIAEIMTNYGLTLDDLRGGRSKASTARQPVPAKYRDRETGATWTGRGRAPLWLAGKNKEDYLIK
jgi:DNA-binding protein H-NS